MTDANKKQNALKLVKVSDIQNLYINIGKSNHLILSPNIKFKHLGGTSSVIQFLCSWQRHHQEVFVILNDQVNIGSNKLAKNEVLLVAFYLAKEVLFKGKDIKADLLGRFIPFIESMNSESLKNYLSVKGNMTGKGKEFKFLFLNKARNEFLKFFYRDTEQFKTKKEIEDFLGDLLKTPVSAIQKSQYTQNLNPIKEIIYEILNNTDKHARRDIKQALIPKNIRGFFLNFYDLNDNNRQSFVDNQPEYGYFLKNVMEVLVISIFDSGEGIVKKYIETTSDKKEEEMSSEDKKNILLKVFLPKTTSSKVPNSGMGLTYTKKNIKKLKGLLSIKTNTLEYFLTPDENRGYKKTFEDCKPCVGTSVVMLIPLKFKEIE